MTKLNYKINLTQYFFIGTVGGNFLLTFSILAKLLEN